MDLKGWISELWHWPMAVCAQRAMAAIGVTVEGPPGLDSLLDPLNEDWGQALAASGEDDDEDAENE